MTVLNGTLAFTAAPVAVNADLILTNGTLTTSVDLPISGALQQSGGYLKGTGTVTVTGLFTWSGGRQEEAGETVANGGMLSSGTAYRYLNGRTLTLNAASTFSGTGNQLFWNAATLNNNASLDIQTDADLAHYSGTVSTFNNTSTVTKSTGSAATLIGANFINTGTVTVLSGEFRLSCFYRDVHAATSWHARCPYPWAG